MLIAIQLHSHRRATAMLLLFRKQHGSSLSAQRSGVVVMDSPRRGIHQDLQRSSVPSRGGTEESDMPGRLGVVIFCAGRARSTAGSPGELLLWAPPSSSDVQEVSAPCNRAQLGGKPGLQGQRGATTSVLQSTRAPWPRDTAQMHYTTPGPSISLEKRGGEAIAAPIQTHSVSPSHPSPSEYFLAEHKAGLLCCRSLRVHPGGAGWDSLWVCRNNPSLQQRTMELEQM